MPEPILETPLAVAFPTACQTIHEQAFIAMSSTYATADDRSAELWKTASGRAVRQWRHTAKIHLGHFREAVASELSCMERSRGVSVTSPDAVIGAMHMRALIPAAIAAALLTGPVVAQPASPVPGSQPGTKAPGADLPKKNGTGSGSAPIGPPSTPANPGATPGASSVPGAPGAPSTPKGTTTAPEASKKLDTPSAGGGTK
jgi:hypothetical protein